MEWTVASGLGRLDRVKINPSRPWLLPRQSMAYADNLVCLQNCPSFLCGAELEGSLRKLSVHAIRVAELSGDIIDETQIFGVEWTLQNYLHVTICHGIDKMINLRRSIFFFISS